MRGQGYVGGNRGAEIIFRFARIPARELLANRRGGVGGAVEGVILCNAVGCGGVYRVVNRHGVNIAELQAALCAGVAVLGNIMMRIDVCVLPIISERVNAGTIAFY